MVRSPRGKIFVFIILGFFAFAALFLLRAKEEMVDFEVNYKAGQRISLGETLYRIEDGHYQFKYSPFSALLYMPLSYLPLSLAKAIWFFLILFSIYFIMLTARHLLRLGNKNILLTVLPLLILAKFFLRELQLGQINALITMILLFMVRCLTSDEEHHTVPPKILTGVLWGISTALKPYTLVFLFYFLIKKKWIAGISGIIILLASFCIPSFFYGLDGNMSVHQEWISTLSRSTPALLDSQDNISIIGFLMKWTANQKISIYSFLGLMITLAFFFLFLVLRGKKRAPVLDSSILLILIPLLSPLGWDYTLLMSVLGVMIILVHFYDYPLFWRGFLIFNLCVIALSLYDLLGRELYAQFMSWSVITINFLILIGYLAYLRLKRIC